MCRISDRTNYITMTSTLFSKRSWLGGMEAYNQNVFTLNLWNFSKASEISCVTYFTLLLVVSAVYVEVTKIKYLNWGGKSRVLTFPVQPLEQNLRVVPFNE